ncbi:hypothetical protein HOY80DRAFT_89570 [Tuber brumale]|nr:hypothetical protein HOY80DRAFT_89570 [Tuber brumale]
MFFCVSRFVKLGISSADLGPFFPPDWQGWCQIAGLFRGRSVLECRNKYQDVTHGPREAIQCYNYDCEHSPLGRGRRVFDDNSRSIRRKPLSIPTVAEDPVPELIMSRDSSPAGSPVADRRVTTKRSWGRIGDVEIVDEGTIYRHSYGNSSSDKHYHSSKKAKTITNLSDELNFVLSQQWSSNVNVTDRIQEDHAMSQRALEKYWSGFELVEVSSVLGNQL